MNKKILTILTSIMVLILVGCSNNENLINAENNGIVGNENNQMQESDNNLINNSSEQIDEEKYKLSNTYYISGEKLDTDESIINLNSNNVSYKEHYYIESDGVEFDISCNLIETDNEFQTYDVKINGQTLEIQTNFTGNASDSFGLLGDIMWIIDLDENDEYKELVLIRVYGIESELNIYRLAKNGPELLFDVGTVCDELIKVGNKWIFTNYFYDVDEYEFTMGYYTYEDGEFKYIDRFATGESITYENGIFPEEFQKLEFSSNNGLITVKTSKGNIEGTFNLISYKKSNTDGEAHEDVKYSIRLTQDSICRVESTDENYTNDSVETIPAGTVIEDVIFKFMY